MSLQDASMVVVEVDFKVVCSLAAALSLGRFGRPADRYTWLSDSDPKYPPVPILSSSSYVSKAASIGSMYGIADESSIYCVK